MAKFDAEGSPVWAREFGTLARDWAHGVAVDRADGVYVAGMTGGALVGPGAGGYDAFVRKYDGAGTEIWTVQMGTAGDDGAAAIAVHGSGALYVAGFVEGPLPGQTWNGSRDAFVARWSDATAEITDCPRPPAARPTPPARRPPRTP